MEDTDATLEEVELRFGARVRRLVEEVTDDKTLPKPERKRLQVERAPHSSPGAKLVKLADKLYNLRDLNRCTPKGRSPPPHTHTGSEGAGRAHLLEAQGAQFPWGGGGGGGGGEAWAFWSIPQTNPTGVCEGAFRDTSRHPALRKPAEPACHGPSSVRPLQDGRSIGSRNTSSGRRRWCEGCRAPARGWKRRSSSCSGSGG